MGLDREENSASLNGYQTSAGSSCSGDPYQSGGQNVSTKCTKPTLKVIDVRFQLGLDQQVRAAALDPKAPPPYVRLTPKLLEGDCDVCVGAYAPEESETPRNRAECLSVLWSSVP